MELSSFLTDLKNPATARGITIDHFDVDFGKEGVEYDGDYGRILATEGIVHGLGWKVGIIGNAWAYPQDCGSIPANICARDRTTQFWMDYFKTTGLPDKLIFQQWQPNPDTLGSDTDAKRHHFPRPDSCRPLRLGCSILVADR